MNIKDNVIELNGNEFRILDFIEAVEIEEKIFAYDGCHKIYIIETEKDKEEAISYGYKIIEIEKLEEVYENSCSLKFISNWSLTKQFLKQLI